MTTENSRLRGEFLNTQVIARDTGKRLGVVKDLLVDVDQREVVALGLRDNVLSLTGMLKYMYLNSIKQTGDVVLVEDEDVIEDIDSEMYTNLINSEVITETGEPLGRVRDFIFNLDEGQIDSLIIASLGLPQIPDQFISTYELPIEEIMSSGPNRVIVFEGAEDRISQLTEGILERLGIGRPIWERDEEEELDSITTIKPDNQLPTVTSAQRTQKRVEVKTPIRQDYWEDEDRWEDEAPAAPPRRKVRYQEYEEEPETRNGGGDRYENYQDDNVEQDVWDDDLKSEPYKGPRISIPQKRKEPEYEEKVN